MKPIPALLLLAALAAGLAGCGAVRSLHAPGPPDEDFTPPEVSAAPRGEAGGVFATGSPWLLTSDVRAFRPGDVLTVVLQETTQASKSADTRFGKESGVEFSPLTIGGTTVDTNVGIGGKRDFSGNAMSTQQNELSGAITVIVHEVLANGLLYVKGEKSLFLNQGEEFVRVAGLVRAQDIDGENRVSSQRIANAKIAYSGRGSLNEANAPGWLTRFFVSSWMPF